MFYHSEQFKKKEGRMNEHKHHQESFTGNYFGNKILIYPAMVLLVKTIILWTFELLVNYSKDGLASISAHH